MRNLWFTGSIMISAMINATRVIALIIMENMPSRANCSFARFAAQQSAHSMAYLLAPPHAPPRIPLCRSVEVAPFHARLSNPSLGIWLKIIRSGEYAHTLPLQKLQRP